jgi:hypothetical protein
MYLAREEFCFEYEDYRIIAHSLRLLQGVLVEELGDPKLEDRAKTEEELDRVRNLTGKITAQL